MVGARVAYVGERFPAHIEALETAPASADLAALRLVGYALPEIV